MAQTSGKMVTNICNHQKQLKKIMKLWDEMIIDENEAPNLQDMIAVANGNGTFCESFVRTELNTWMLNVGQYSF